MVDQSCLNGNLTDTINHYVLYIDSMINSNINNKKINQEFCFQQTEISNTISPFLPYAFFHTHILNQVTSFLNVGILEPIIKSSFFMGLFTITISGIILHSLCELKNGPSRIRKGFSRSIKHNILNKQNHRCGQCNRILTVVDFHHKNGDRSDNSERNCQALCPSCHATVTRGTLKGR
ncbi:MAG TPA: hypothetical protein VD815_01545 [Candidatus Saccharimonadales bacterium]|nr:hypothetical protein [Candidatus Saccharimonadales bacterium]